MKEFSCRKKRIHFPETNGCNPKHYWFVQLDISPFCSRGYFQVRREAMDHHRTTLALRRSKGQCETDPDRKVQIQDEIIIARSVRDVSLIFCDEVAKIFFQRQKQRSNLRMAIWAYLSHILWWNHWYDWSWKRFKATFCFGWQQSGANMHPHGSSTPLGFPRVPQGCLLRTEPNSITVWGVSPHCSCVKYSDDY